MKNKNLPQEKYPSLSFNKNLLTIFVIKKKKLWYKIRSPIIKLLYLASSVFIKRRMILTPPNHIVNGQQ